VRSLRERAAPAEGVVVQPTVLAPGLAADEATGLVELVPLPSAERSGAEAAPAAGLDAQIDQAESLVDALVGQARDAVAAAGPREPETPAEAGDEADTALLLAARAGDEAALSALLTRYRAFARAKARSYFLVGADREDVVQEGMIGLYKAIRDFDPAQQTSFRGFADVCVTRQILTAVKSATRHKHGPLNDYVSFERPVGEEGEDPGERTLSDVLAVRAVSDPADLVISAERVRALQAHVDEVLSDLETEVLRLYVEGRSYQEIAETLQRHVKAIDNALQRIKKKLEGHLRARAAADAG
jgi:RNA polymerase sporulation-specific sigma factor